MSRNVNPWATEILSWHGHDRGGVRVPFQSDFRPLQGVLITGLLQKLQELALQLSSGQPDKPRWIFLVGGPGNGKSEAVEYFLGALDTGLQLNGNLTSYLAGKFSRGQVMLRHVEVTPTDLSTNAQQFADNIGRLIIVQDATATEDPQGDAARALAKDLEDLVTTNEQPLPVFIVCANRGLLARTITEASREYGPDNDITKILSEIIKASGLGIETLSRTRKPCWPITDFPHVACWPLDLESLLEAKSPALPPILEVLAAATTSQKWEVNGRCLDCDARGICPFRQNSEWLRNPERLSALIRILRRGELATGQRWNFRSLFSLIAELLVGQWQDFENNASPCEWVHSQRVFMSNDVDPQALSATYYMSRRLYHHALFNSIQIDSIAEKLLPKVTGSQPLSQRLLEILSASPIGSSKHVRDYLIVQYAALDPALATPTSADHILRVIENNYSQSILLGNSDNTINSLAEVERILLWYLGRAEGEWDRLGRASDFAKQMVNLLRKFTSVLVKRAVACERGHHANEEFLDDYIFSLRERARLSRLTTGLQSLLGGGNFSFDLVETFGQPQSERSAIIQLIGPQPGFRADVAPTVTENMPGHDVPCFEITGTGGRIPITFELFLALRLRQSGCASSSLPASVRASIDRIRQRYAGTLCRSTDKFLDQTVTIQITDTVRVVFTDVNDPISIERIEQR